MWRSQGKVTNANKWSRMQRAGEAPRVTDGGIPGREKLLGRAIGSLGSMYGLEVGFRQLEISHTKPISLRLLLYFLKLRTY